MNENFSSKGYDTLASEYDVLMESSPYYVNIRTAEAAMLSKALDSRKGGYLLDLGCGTGFASILGAARGLEVYGVDPSGRMLATAHRRLRALGTIPHLFQGRLEELPALGRAFDIVVAFGSVLNHVDKLDVFFEKIRNNSYPGTDVLITADNILGTDAFTWAWYRLFDGQFDGFRDLWQRITAVFSGVPHLNKWTFETPLGPAAVHLRYDSPARVLSSLRDKNFQVLEIQGVNCLACLSRKTILSCAQLTCGKGPKSIGMRMLASVDRLLSASLWRLAGSYVIHAKYTGRK